MTDLGAWAILRHRGAERSKIARIVNDTEYSRGQHGGRLSRSRLFQLPRKRSRAPQQRIHPLREARLVIVVAALLGDFSGGFDDVQ